MLVVWLAVCLSRWVWPACCLPGELPEFCLVEKERDWLAVVQAWMAVVRVGLIRNVVYRGRIRETADLRVEVAWWVG